MSGVLLGRQARWVIVAWLLMIVLGAATTGFLRAQVGSQINLGLQIFNIHRWLGAAMGVGALVLVVRRPGRDRLLGVALIVAALLFGWWAARSLAPRVVAVHATLSSFAAVVLSSLPAGARKTLSRAPTGRRRWLELSARLAFGLMLVQVTLGALLRHQLISLPWHLLAGGMAALALLIPALTILYDSTAGVADRRVARWAMTAVLVQVSLGATVFVLILVRSPPAWLWLAATIGHVSVGTVTLLATAAFSRQWRA